MYKKTMTYENFDGEEVTEDFYFNLTAAEVMELEVSEREGFSESMKKIVEAGDGKEIIAGFKHIVLISYGLRDDKGRFYRDAHETAVFASSQAYSDFFMELATDTAAGAAFVNAVVPKDLEKQAAKLQKLNQQQAQASVQNVEIPVETVTVPTVTELPPPTGTPVDMSDYEAWRAAQAAQTPQQ